MIALLASLLISTNASPRQIVHACREMIPANVELSGRIVMRNRRGVVLKEHAYVLKREQGQTELFVDNERLFSSSSPSPSSSPSTPILGTDVTPSDVTLDYLWWDDVSFDKERTGETVSGQVCVVLILKKGDRAVRVWIDRKTGALMQAEEFQGEKAVRRLWGTRLKKFGDRWMANVLEVETLGSGHRTKIIVEELK